MKRSAAAPYGHQGRRPAGRASRSPTTPAAKCPSAWEKPRSLAVEARAACTARAASVAAAGFNLPPLLLAAAGWSCRHPTAAAAETWAPRFPSGLLLRRAHTQRASAVSPNWRRPSLGDCRKRCPSREASSADPRGAQGARTPAACLRRRSLLGTTRVRSAPVALSSWEKESAVANCERNGDKRKLRF